MYDYINPESGDGYFASDIEEQFDELIDELFDHPEILGVTFAPSAVVKEMDPTTYEEGFYDYIDNLVANGDLVEFEDYDPDDYDDDFGDHIE